MEAKPDDFCALERLWRHQNRTILPKNFQYPYNIIRLMRKLNGHLSIVTLIGRKFKIINLATLESSLRSKKQNLKIFNVHQMLCKIMDLHRSMQMIEF